MSIHNHHYRDPEFNAAQTANYSLLIQIEAVSFSYAVVNQEKLLLLEENIDLSELTEPSEEHSRLFSEYKARVIGLPQNGFTFVPVSLFRSSHVADYARFLDVKPRERAFSQPLDAENQVIYKVDEQIADTVAKKFDVKNTVFSANGWITATAATNPADHYLYLNINRDKVEFLNFRAGKLRFYNVFEFKTPDELVYFTLFVARELNLQAQDITISLSGDFNINDENAERLRKFLGKVDVNRTRTFDLPWAITSPTILTLTALALCGSSEVR